MEAHADSESESAKVTTGTASGKREAHERASVSAAGSETRSGRWHGPGSGMILAVALPGRRTEPSG